MPVTVQISVDLGLTKGQNRIVFRNPRGLKRYYAFYIHPAVFGVTNATVSYEYSADGITWVPGTATFTFVETSGDAHVHCWDIKIWDDGSQLEVWGAAIGYQELGDDFQTRYRYGTIADAASLIAWGAEQTIDADINDEGGGEPHCIAIARTDNDEIVVAFTEDIQDMGKDFRQIKLIGSDGSGAAPNWSGEEIWDDPSGSNDNQDKWIVLCGLESFSSSYPDDFLIYARVPDDFNNTAYVYATAVPDWDEGGAGFTNTTQNRLDLIAAQSDLLSGLIDEADISHLVYRRSATHVSYYKAGSAGDDNWGSDNLVTTDAIDALTISLDTGPSPDELYVFWHTSTETVDYSYKVTPVDSVSFSDEKTVSYHQDIIALSSWNRVIENSLHVAGQYGTTVWYNEQPVFLALSTTLADLEFPDQNYFIGPHDL